MNTQKILELRKQGMGYKKIAKELNISIPIVSKTLIENGIIDHIKLPSQEIVEKVIEMYSNGYGYVPITKELKISQQMVANILNLNKVKVTPKSYHSDYQNKVNHNYFSCIDTERKAYWLGLLYADGYNNENFYQVEITLKKEDKELLEALKKDLNSNYRISDRVSELNGRDFESSRFTIYSKKVSEDLKKLGCMQAKSLILTFPTEDIVPKHLVHHFMRGYFDGDGCISNSHFSVVGTYDFVKEYEKVIRANVDISPAGRTIEEGKAFSWIHTSKRDTIKIYEYLYKDATICLTRKKQRFLNLID